MATRKPSTPRQRTRKDPPLPDIYFRINSLLHTMRCIAQHEDQLCTIAHDVKQTGTLNAETIGELNVLLEDLPSGAYAEEVAAIHSALDLIVTFESPAKSPKKTKTEERMKVPSRRRASK